ncbi:MAG: LytTR family DNA-binding domain-containing protein [Dorea sp.]|nr:LytTR family DNA-binding domain-containing protein [Dorea sp.]
MRVAVIDDERPARSELKHQIRAVYPDIEIIEGDCGADALDLAAEYTFDLIFLDVDLGDINGTMLVKALRKMQEDVKIVFVTAYTEYAVKAFELEVQDYVMKPFKQDRIQKILNKYLGEKVAASEEEEADFQTLDKRKRISINADGKTIFEDVSKILYIETFNRGCRIVAKKDEYQDSRSIGELEKKLQNCGFFRIHKSYLVNIAEIHEVFPWGNNTFGLRVTGDHKEVLSISRERMKMLRQILDL